MARRPARPSCLSTWARRIRPRPRRWAQYLKAFLSDPRVVEIPRLAWLPILHGLILPFRSRASAMKYESIWLREAHMTGSPLLVHTERQAHALQQHMHRLGHDVTVACAMRYGNPSIASVMEALRRQGTEQVLLLPLYPQFSGTTTATAFDEVFRVLAGWRNQPELRLIKALSRSSGLYFGPAAAGERLTGRSTACRTLPGATS